MLRPLAALALPLSMLLAGGCARGGDFPSLAPRAVESLSWDEPVRASVAVAPEPGLDAAVERALAEARRGEAEFRAVLPAARRLAAAAGAQGSESWIAAQQALSRAEAAREPTAAALAELNALAVARAVQPTNEAQSAALQAALQSAAAISSAQIVDIDALHAAIVR